MSSDGILARLIVYPILATAVLFVFTRVLESRLIFFPSHKVTATPADIGLLFEDVTFDAQDGTRLSGWFLPAPEAERTALFFHGNAGNIGHRLEKIKILHELGLSVFIIDYRGYGKSGGRPNERGIERDADAAWLYLTGTRKLTPASIVLYGESLGGAFASRLAARRPCGALITEGAFTSAPDMAKLALPFVPRFFLSLKLDTLSSVSKAALPKLFIHSLDDEIVPYKMGERLFAAAAGPKTLLRLRGGHNTAFLDSYTLYRNGLTDFLDKKKPPPHF